MQRDMMKNQHSLSNITHHNGIEVIAIPNIDCFSTYYCTAFFLHNN